MSMITSVITQATELFAKEQHDKQVRAAVAVLGCIKDHEGMITALKEQLVKIEAGDVLTINSYACPATPCSTSALQPIRY